MFCGMAETSIPYHSPALTVLTNLGYRNAKAFSKKAGNMSIIGKRSCTALKNINTNPIAYTGGQYFNYESLS
jgi:hypothetical protein